MGFLKKIKNKKILKMSLAVLIVVAISGALFSKVFAMQHYYNLDFITGMVTATTLNVRSGPGTNYPTIATVKKNEYIRVFAGIGSWYIVQIEGDYVGAVSKKYVKAIYPNTSNNTGSNTNINTNNNTSTGSTTGSLTSDELDVFNLINKQRNNNGLSSLKIDSDVQRVAKIKARDLVDNNYFSHTSPTYRFSI